MTFPTVNETAAMMVALTTAAYHEDDDTFNDLVSGLNPIELRLLVSALVGTWLSSLGKLDEHYEHVDIIPWFLQELGGDAARGELGADHDD